MLDNTIKHIKTKGDHKISNNGKKGDRFKFTIVNVVGTVNLGINLDLTLLVDNFHDIISRSRFPGVTANLTRPKATIIFFKSGKIVITGARHPQDFPQIIENIRQKLKKLDVKLAPDLPFVLTNVVVKGDIYRELDLNLISLHLNGSIYDPEIFPGIIYKLYAPLLTILIFSTGKIIITGAKSVSQVKIGAKNLLKRLKHDNFL